MTDKITEAVAAEMWRDTEARILSGDPEPVEPFDLPRLSGQPAFPEPGIYFGMSEDDYHAVPAGSTSGLKRMGVSSMNFWADSWLNQDREEEDEKQHFSLGKAIHCLVLEGPEAYAERFAADLDKADYVDEIGKSLLLETTHQIKARIVDFGSKPTTKGYDDATRPARKEDWIAQLLDLEPDALIWEQMLARHRAENEGAQFITAKTDRRVRIAAKMILAHPEIGKAMDGGYGEVSIFWHCKATGLPMKARFDKLKMRLIADIKSFANQGGKPIDRAITTAIASYRYNMQHVIYLEAAEAAKAMIRERGAACITVTPFCEVDEGERQVEWAKKWATQPEPAFLFVFQQTGSAPVTRGKLMPKGTLYSVTKSRVDEMKRRVIECAKAYGIDPWLDIEPVETLLDEEIPSYATDIGRLAI